MDSSNSDCDELFDNFSLQLSEVEMLCSMYPNNSEFHITLPSVLADMNSYIDGKTKCIPNELDFALNLEIPGVKDKLEVTAILPHQYPTQKPSISCRSIGLNRNQQKELNCTLKNYLSNLPTGELCVLSIIDWLTENAGNYFTLQTTETDLEITVKQSASSDLKCRLWIYSHHIFSKFKRRDIIDIAQDLNLSGFSLPGKPGFICVEGTKRACYGFHQRIKQMSWKKLSLVKEEIESEETSLSDFRKFDKFQEISFQVRKGPAKEYHMDMGQFLKYLEEHNCPYAFTDLLGLEGHSSTDK